MASNALALCWKDHHNVLISVFEKLLEKESLVDCTLAAEGKFLKAHKIVLSACSPYLETLLNQENDKHPIIFLRDVEFKDLKTVVEFVYTGVISIPEDHLEEFLNLAEALQIKGLGNVGNKIVEEKSLDEISEKRVTTLPVPKKQLSKSSKLFDTSYKNKTSDPPDENDSSSEKIVDKHRKENKVKMVKMSDIGSSSHEEDDDGEKLNEEIPEVKQEIIDLEFPGTDSVSVEQLTSLAVSCENNEELSIVKPEFEQVTFTEEYSDEMMLEENDTVESVIQPVLDQPGTSHQYSEFTSSDPLYADGVEARGPFIVSDSSKQRSEEFSSEPFDSNRLVSQSQSMLSDPDQLPAAGTNHFLMHWSSSAENANCQLETENSYVANIEEDSIGNENESCISDQQPRKLQCCMCSKWFRYASTLRRHLAEHSKEGPIVCTHCPKRFSHLDELDVHIRLHSGEKRMFQCPHCPKNFNKSGNLKTHLRLHTGERPFQCTYCSKRFNESGNLKKHLRVHATSK